jgi:hypothetical protein
LEAALQALISEHRRCTARMTPLFSPWQAGQVVAAYDLMGLQAPGELRQAAAPREHFCQQVPVGATP